MDPYSHGDPTDAEQHMLELLNRARANPLDEAKRLNVGLQDGTDKDPGGNPKKPIPELPLAPLPFNAQLMQAAGDHAQWLVDTGGGTGPNPHVGKDGSNTKDRIKQAGYQGVLNDFGDGENIAHDFASTTAGAEFAHEGLFRDVGYPDAGHRRVMLGDYDEVGIGGRGNEAVQDFVANNLTGPQSPNPTLPRPKFVLGVAFAGIHFMPLHGRKDVRVDLSGAKFYAMTSASGGYAIPADGLSGTVTVTFTWKGSSTTRTVTLQDKNVKVDVSYLWWPTTKLPPVVWHFVKAIDLISRTALKFLSFGR